MCVRLSSTLGTDSSASLFKHGPALAFICLSILLVIALLPHTLQLCLLSLNVDSSPFNLLTLPLSRVLAFLLHLLPSALLVTRVFIHGARVSSWPPLSSMPHVSLVMGLAQWELASPRRALTTWFSTKGYNTHEHKLTSRENGETVMSDSPADHHGTDIEKVTKETNKEAEDAEPSSSRSRKAEW